MTVFAAEHISMDVLVEMTHDSLKDIGVSAYGHRHKILRGIKDLQARIPERKKHKNAGGHFRSWSIFLCVSVSKSASR